MDYFEIIRMILLVIIMSAAVVDDCRRYRISNRIIICGFIAAAGVFLTEQIMKGGAMQYLTACIAGLGVMSAIYIVKGAGAGDVKLSAVCGMLLGIKGVLIMIISSLICAAVVGTPGSNGKMQCYSDWEYEDAQNSLQHIYGGRVCNCSFNKYLYWRMKGEQDVCNI